MMKDKSAREYKDHDLTIEISCRSCVTKEARVRQRLTQNVPESTVQP